ncbi:MAG TPA: helix-turn-helix domain-containing protein [Usitatibacter sp.]|jgi:putative transcriptional regulator|nr:helix-turn-helix domain-containing protein [Usitatibacter sp.]
MAKRRNKNRFFEDLLQSVTEMDEIVRGERPPSRVFHVDEVSVRAIREATGLTQGQFARLIEVQVGTLRNWEQGRRRPTGPARALLKALKARPKAVIEALQKG